MEYVKLGNSDLRVSRICLGCMGFGDPTIGHRQGPCLTDGRVKFQLLLRFHRLGLSTCASHHGKRQHPCQYPLHVIIKLITCSKSNQKNNIGGSQDPHFFHFSTFDG